MRAFGMLLAGASVLAIAAAGCGAGATPQTPGVWRDSDTVVLPWDAITAAHVLALRQQIAAEAGCPEASVQVAATREVGGFEVLAVQACGTPHYYANVEGRYVRVGSRDWPVEGDSDAPTTTSLETTPPDPELAPDVQDAAEPPPETDAPLAPPVEN